MNLKMVDTYFEHGVPVYKIRKRFVSGVMSGMTIDEYTTADFDVGTEYKPVFGSSNYIIDAKEQIHENPFK